MPPEAIECVKGLWRRVAAWPLVALVRSSISIRSALVITAAGMVAVTVFGGLVATQMKTGIFEARRAQVLEDASVRFSGAQATFEQSTASSPDQVQEVARQTVESTKASAAGAGAVSVLLLRTPGNSGGFRINEIVDPTLDAVVTDQIRTAIRDTGKAHWQSVAIPAAGADSFGNPGILVGMQVRLPRAGVHQLFIVYSLADDQAMVDMVMEVLAIGAVPLLVLVPIGTFWTLHHLLRPVRTTARAASRLAEGDLEARVSVSGVDEMSRLSSAFNDMASSLQDKIVEYDTLSKLQQRFVSDVSHELRTPLTTIRMAEEMIWQDRDALKGPSKRSAELLHGQVARFESMLSDLLEISRYDARSTLLDTETTDLRPLVEKVVTANEELASRLSVRVQIHAPGQRCAAEIDSRRIERVLRNLLVNAVEHADGTAVDIHVAATPTDVAVRVRDHGVGMSEEVVDRVFDRFYRADPARARTTGGTGLGLSIAREDVSAHGGTIEAWGRPGQGASFLVTLPKTVGDPVRTRPLELWKEE
ncbi:HAMP domain-containing histidine kinase [Schaalia sp. 19OD2882]|uniref:MtrAB system histidine kinase MtrB n=1 Tax=Schaalia sp. 19OD2882 TaxID=2794089 RepID=UPI001C1EA098|nr:MtrAB system histidine kinase MtrB [Schaalia sp. 19OD2882]QWW20307.1 HAMP domain-containing histidine kinase [Schaalia sp. 19OD2882]